ncbi:glycoside hydrolase family 44 protein [Gorillibacterium sp. sgz5001074]|uniref:glycoside hydrolase family 44 protein n=1 Tax=Gorillibacterium sp. sgz5001074 TaxID=3446695 RepID=UPI003F663487
MRSSSVRPSFRSTWALSMSFVLAAGLWAVPPKEAYGETVQPLAVYADGLSPEFVNYGWADMDLAQSGTVHSGTSAVRLNPDGDTALYFYKDRIMNADDYQSLDFWVHGGASGGQKLKLVFSLGGEPVGETMIGAGPSDRILGGSWSHRSVPLRQLGVNGIIDGIWIWGEGDQADVYLDDMVFVPGSGGSPTPTPTPTQSPTPTPTPTSSQTPSPTPTSSPGGGTPSPGQNPVTGIAFAERSLALKTGTNKGVSLHTVTSNGTSAPIPADLAAWSSDDETVARVQGGLVQGMAAGSTVIRAVYGGFSASLPVTVTAPAPGLPIEPVNGFYLYDEALGSHIADYSWADHTLSEVGTVHTGAASIRLTPDGDKALYLYSGSPLTAREYEKLRLWVNGGEAGGQQLKLVFTAGGQPVKTLDLDALAAGGDGGLKAGEWSAVELALAELELPGGLFDGLMIAGAVDGMQPPVYLDDLAMIKKSVESARILELRMDKHGLLLLPGEAQQLKAEAFLSTGDTADVSGKAAWTTDRPDLIRLSPDGGLTALAEGIARIDAGYKGLTATAFVQVASVTAEPVYRDGLAGGFRDLSWHDKDLANREQAHEGSLSIKFEPDGWDGVWLDSDTVRKIEEYYGLEFWIHGGSAGAQQLLVHLYDGDTNIGNVDLQRYLPESGLPAGQWTRVRVNMADMELSEGDFDGMIFQAGTDRDQGAVYIDEISFLRNNNPGQLPEPELPGVEVNVDTGANRRAINPDIYGINFDDNHPTESTLEFPVQRWGGNNTTRYNWELDVANRASDWYFINYPYDNEHPEQLPNGSTSDRFIDDTIARNGKVLLTVPTIGWTPKDRTLSYGFSRAKYGAQQEYAYELPDAGNGVLPNGEWMTGNDPRDTSKPIGPDFVTRWMDHIAGRTGDKVNYYALDNEPEIWHVTHRDVHPQAPTYDEIWGFTEKYGSAIKQKDPDAQIFGPTSWGWCAYFYSSADNCAEGPDRSAHGNTPFLQWYLEQVKAHQQETGVRLVDYLDVHYYSQEQSVPSFEEGPYAAKRRFQALKALYDPNFVDDSWIQEPIRLIPRMKEMIADTLPDMKLAISEYNFGNGDGITAGLAQAEALAIFGREGVDLATRFGTLPANSPLEDAFKLYLNYDGQGSKIEGTSVKASTSNRDAVGAYAIDGTDGKLYVLLFNKDTVSREAHVATGENGSEAALYRFNANSRLSAAGAARSDANGQLSLKLPPRSATLVVLP